MALCGRVTALAGHPVRAGASIASRLVSRWFLTVRLRCVIGGVLAVACGAVSACGDLGVDAPRVGEFDGGSPTTEYLPGGADSDAPGDVVAPSIGRFDRDRGSGSTNDPVTDGGGTESASIDDNRAVEVSPEEAAASGEANEVAGSRESSNGVSPEVAGITTLPTSVAPTVTTPPTSLAAGAADPSVRAIEQRLNLLGYQPGPVDDHYDAQTASAVRAFEKRMERTPDGVLDAEDRAELFSRAADTHPMLDAPVVIDRTRQLVMVALDGDVGTLDATLWAPALIAPGRYAIGEVWRGRRSWHGGLVTDAVLVGSVVAFATVSPGAALPPGWATVQLSTPDLAWLTDRVDSGTAVLVVG